MDKTITPKLTTRNKAYLNIGCGNIYSSEWNNIDFIDKKDVFKWDIRKGLPYPNNSMDGVYFSHVLEHMTPNEAECLLNEVSRVTKKGGVVRIAVPDLKRICEEYLNCLNNAEKDPSQKNSMRYDWIMLELIDQMVREKSGGLMRETIDSGNFDKEYARSRIGDLVLSGKIQKNIPDSKIITLLKKIKRSLKTFTGAYNPRKTGEVHRWMYDNFSLRRLLKNHNFSNIKVQNFNTSMMPDWDQYQFDRSKFDPTKAKKPESIFIEGIKT